MTWRAMGGRPWEEELYAALKLVRSEIDILKQQEAVQKKIFDHYKGIVDAAEELAGTHTRN